MFRNLGIILNNMLLMIVEAICKLVYRVSGFEGRTQERERQRAAEQAQRERKFANKLHRMNSRALNLGGQIYNGLRHSIGAVGNPMLFVEKQEYKAGKLQEYNITVHANGSVWHDYVAKIRVAVVSIGTEHDQKKLAFLIHVEHPRFESYEPDRESIKRLIASVTRITVHQAA